jgi:hypothetical protein
MESKAGGRVKQVFPPESDSQTPMQACPGCGATARRTSARFCLSCGRSLAESYLPADALRASYNAPRRRSSVSRLDKDAGVVNLKPLKSSPSSREQARNINGASTTALAFVTYALVPYLGILFCPGALLMGGVGLYNSYRAPERGGRRASYTGLLLGFLILCIQLFLWWILYKIPEWTRQ